MKTLLHALIVGNLQMRPHCNAFNRCCLLRVFMRGAATVRAVSWCSFNLASVLGFGV
jgi:hypothetical protein